LKKKISKTEIICRIPDGKIVEIREEADMLGLNQQIGMELKPKEGRNKSFIINQSLI